MGALHLTGDTLVPREVLIKQIRNVKRDADLGGELVAGSEVNDRAFVAVSVSAGRSLIIGADIFAVVVDEHPGTEAAVAPSQVNVASLGDEPRDLPSP